MYQELLAPIHAFLQSTTPDAWVDEAKKEHNLSTLLQDHLLCELKAAQNAVFLLKRYVLTPQAGAKLLAFIEPYQQFAYQRVGDLASLKGKNKLTVSLQLRSDCTYGDAMLNKMVALIQEELHHFYQVLKIIHTQGMHYEPVPASRYAKGLTQHIRTYEPEALVDKLIIGAFIEARSCERFAKLAPHLSPDLEKFYTLLLRSEARHFQDYLVLAQSISKIAIQPRVAYFAELEADLINTPDADFKFHSGTPNFI